MERVSVRSIPACPTLFTPLQVHVRELLRFGTVSWVGWMRDHIKSLQTMIEEDKAAVVVAGASLTYSHRRLFHDGDTIDIGTTSSVHRKGILIEGKSKFSSLDKEFATMNIYFRPVAIGDEHSAAAKPSNLPPELRSLFKDPEIRSEMYPRPVKDLLPKVTTEGTLLAQRRAPIKLHRYAMDFADQWAFMETASFVGANREALAQDQSHLHDRLIDGLSVPVAEYHVELVKPYFMLDDGIVETNAYLYADSLYFTHRLLSNPPAGEQVHANVIERMEGPVRH